MCNELVVLGPLSHHRNNPCLCLCGFRRLQSSVGAVNDARISAKSLCCNSAPSMLGYEGSGENVCVGDTYQFVC